MKILHITNEFSKKNYSISSLIEYITKLFDKSERYQVKIISSNIDENLFEKSRVQNFKLTSWIDFIFRASNLKKEFNNNDIIHVHGIWAPIQLFSIIYGSIFHEKKIVIHPHGMLLDEALKSAGSLKYIFKRITLHILKYLINYKISFISITNQETDAIKKFFIKNQITKIPNPIPFDLSEQSSNQKKKQIIYFGRIHPHKNLEMLINSFIKANLGNDWTLKIYGIKDDENYRNKILKLANKSKNIKIYDPVFGEERQKIMSTSWANILISKSEVLSLSILESSYYGLPTITSEKIELSELNQTAIPTKLTKHEISKKIKEISNWSLDKRLKKNDLITKNFRDLYSKYNSEDTYKHFYSSKHIPILNKQNVQKTNIEKTFIDKINLNFLVISGVYTFNLMFASLFVIILVLFKKFSIAGEVGLASSFWLSLTQIFSSNMRSIAIAENDERISKDTLIYRFIFSGILFIIAYLIFNHFISSLSSNLLISLSLLILFQWMFEMKLVRFEIKNNTKFFYFIFCVNLLFLVTMVSIIKIYGIDLSQFVIYIYIGFLTLFIIGDLIFPKNFINIISTIKTNITTIAFASSLSIISSSFIWRLLIFTFFERSIAGIFYACFSIGSFPGTLFNSVIGPTFIKKKIEFNKYLIDFSKLFFVLIAILFIYSSYQIYLLYNSNSFNFLSSHFFMFVTTISLMGSYFMSFAMFKRHKLIQEGISEREGLFLTDIIYGLSITLFVPILYFTGGIFATSFAFFVASAFAFMIYSRA